MDATVIMAPSITVLMSVFNGGRWLSRSIKSILNQTYIDFEFIIVMDGCTDDSLSIANFFADQDHRIVIYEKPNTGLADSLNYGISHARGDWIVRIDADDVCESDRIEKQTEYLNRYPRVILVGSGLYFLNEDDVTGGVYNYPTTHEKLVSRLVTGRAFFPHSSAVYKASAVRQIGGYRARIRRAEDWDLWLRLSEVGQISCVDYPLVGIRRHSDQISHSEGGKAQLIDSYVAMVSYWLRRLGYTDPVDLAYSDDAFVNFRDWVGEKMEVSGLFEMRRIVTNVNNEIRYSKNVMQKIKILVIFFVTHPALVRRYISFKILGCDISKKSAYEWAEQQQVD